MLKLLLIASLILPSLVFAKEVDATVDPNDVAVISDHQQLLVATKHGETFRFNLIPTRPEDLALFHSMSAGEQIKFQVRRAGFLKQAATLLNFSGLTFGVGSLVASKIKMLRNPNPSMHVNPIKELAAEMEAIENQNKIGLRERSHQIKENILRGIDSQLVSSSKLVASVNEFSLHVGASPALGAALIGKRSMGGTTGFVLNIGYNHMKRGMFIEAIPEYETIDRAFTPALLASVVPKFGVTFAARDGKTDSAIRQGNGFGPPGIPGYVTTTPKQISIGTNSGLILAAMFVLVLKDVPDWAKYLSVMGAVADYYSFTTKSTQYSALRFMVSPLLPKFHEFSSGFGLFRQGPRNSCTALF